MNPYCFFKPSFFFPSFPYSYAITDLTFIRDLFDHAFQALAQHGTPFIKPLCDLLRIFGKPYHRTKSHEEYASLPIFVDILEILTNVLMWDTVPEIHMAVATSLLSFVQAIGFDDPKSSTGSKETKEEEDKSVLPSSSSSPKRNTPTTIQQSYSDQELRSSVWNFHQQLLRERNALSTLTSALRNAVAEYFHDVAAGRTRVEEVIAHANAGIRTLEGTYAGSITTTSTTSSSTSPRHSPSDAPTGVFTTTNAVKTASVIRSPDLLTILARILRECSEGEENALLLTRARLPNLCIEILHSISSIQDELAHIILEILWNLLEISNRRASAASAGSYGDACLNLNDLLDKHRNSNAAKMVGNPQDIYALGSLLRDCIEQGVTQEDKEFRNDLLVVLTLIAAKPEIRPFFASTGVLQLILYISTAAEMMGTTGGLTKYIRPLPSTSGTNLIGNNNNNNSSFGSTSSSFFALGGSNENLLSAALPVENFNSSAPVDLEFKQLAWAFVAVLCQGSYADYVISPSSSSTEESKSPHPSTDPSEEHATVTCISAVRESRFVQTLLLYTNPLTTESVYIRAWSPIARRTLDIYALQILATVAPFFPQYFIDTNGLEALLAYLRIYGGPKLNISKATSSRSPNLSSMSPEAGGNSNNANNGYAFPIKPILPSSNSLKHSTEADGDSLLLRSSIQSIPSLPASKPFLGNNNIRGRTSVPSFNKPINNYNNNATADLRLSASPPPGENNALTYSATTERDIGRQYWALRVLHVLADIDARIDPEAHLSSMLTAGVPTVVAPHGRNDNQSGSSNSRSTNPKTPPIGYEISARLGESGFIEILVAILKRAEAEGTGMSSPVTSPGGTVNQVTQTRTFNPLSLTNQGTKRSVHVNTTGRGQGITEVTPAAGSTEGSKQIEPDLLLEETLLTLSSLTTGAITAATAKGAKLLHHITSLIADEGAKDGALDRLQAQIEEEQHQSHQDHQESEEKYGDHPPHALATTASTDSLHLSLVSRLKDNQDRFRKCGGVSCVIRLLKRCVPTMRNRGGGEFSSSDSRPRVTTAAVAAVRSLTVCNVRSEARFLADGGIDALLDLVEVSPNTLRPLALTALADLASNPISHICVRCWRSDATGASAGVLLLKLWVEEEKRLGVVHEPARGVISNVTRPLDGADSRARQIAMFHAVHTSTAAAVKDIIPGGRVALAEGYSNSSKARRSSVTGETTAFRGLRRALRAAKLWQHVESASPGGPIATIVNTADLRHKLYATLQSIGFNEVEQQLVEKQEAQVAMLESSDKAIHEIEMGDEAVAEVQAQADLTGRFTEASSPTNSTTDNGSVNNLNNNNNNSNNTNYDTVSPKKQEPVAAFPDLKPSHLVSLEMAKAYPELIMGSAWDDVRTRLHEMNIEPVVADSNTLLGHLHDATRIAERVKALQCIHADKAVSVVVESEHKFIADVLDSKAAEEASLKFKEKNKRKPWASSGKSFTGLTLEERKAGIASRNAMLQNSYLGFHPYPNMPVPTTDEVGVNDEVQSSTDILNESKE